jgi:hypothetical protein
MLKGISSRVLLQEFPHLRKKFWGRHFWASEYLAASSGTITDEMIREYIDDQEGEQIIWLCVSIDLGKYARKTLHVSALAPCVGFLDSHAIHRGKKARGEIGPQSVAVEISAMERVPRRVRLVAKI